MPFSRKARWQQYLGKAEDIIAALGQPPKTPSAVPESAVVTEFGAAAALFDLAQRLRLVEHIDRHVAAHRGPPGPSVGTYLLIAALNRCLDPRSKAQIAPWFERTILRRLLDVRAEQLTSQRFWDQMDRVSPQSIVAIERDLVAHLLKEFDLDVRQVLFDATNFFTFIDTFNERCTVAQRGHSKEGRAAWRIVGLALLVTSDFHIPLCHQTYPGNQPDAPTFAGLTAELIARHETLANGVEDITLIFDRSQHHVEAAFRDMKNVHYLALRPQRHWTDQKIQVHVFYCVLALMLCGLLRRELERKGIKRSLPALLEDLGQIREVCVAYPASQAQATPQVAITLSALSKEQRALYDALDLGRYRSP